MKFHPLPQQRPRLHFLQFCLLTIKASMDLLNLPLRHSVRACVRARERWRALFYWERRRLQPQRQQQQVSALCTYHNKLVVEHLQTKDVGTKQPNLHHLLCSLVRLSKRPPLCWWLLATKGEEASLPPINLCDFAAKAHPTLSCTTKWGVREIQRKIIIVLSTAAALSWHLEE